MHLKLDIKNENGFKLSVCSLARYKIACELIKFPTGNLPSSALTPIFEEVFFVPRRCLHKIK
jgi:hypothetical protein